MFLYETLDGLRRREAPPLPAWIRENLNPRLPLRPYQEAAFQNFSLYWERLRQQDRPCQLLFHMATGSGKTLVMAGLMADLYRRGYRNFLFFVNLTAIVRKTRENFLNPRSAKYLFAPELRVDGRRVPVREVSGFSAGDPDAINLLFTTTQALHAELWQVRENGLSPAELAAAPVVLISDEAHHLNAATKRAGRAEADSRRSWEETVERVFLARPDNVLLEFTATCDLHNPQILETYRDKIVYSYPLRTFRAEGYSKEILTLRTDLPPMERALQALMLSQYRLKLFQSRRLAVKPVVLFKSAAIRESAAFQAAFASRMETLSGPDLARAAAQAPSPVLERALTWFQAGGISLDALAQELRQEFSPLHCISANDEADVEAKQLLLNSLEDPENPYRAVFEVKKLDEGWDVLNLFDIVRLYETRQSGGPSASTVSEAQLIGRGARYCPFQTAPDQPRYQRKFDRDLEDPLRVCETLYYHCQNDSRYIAELHSALRETGLGDERPLRRLRLKPAFRDGAFYREGVVLANRRLQAEPPAEATGFPASLRNRVWTVTLATGAAGEDVLLATSSRPDVQSGAPCACRTTFGNLAEQNYAIVRKALARRPAFQFDALKRRFPQLASTRMFVTDPRYLGAVRLEIRSQFPAPPAPVLCEAAGRALDQMAPALFSPPRSWRGSRFFPCPAAEVFRERTVAGQPLRAADAGGPDLSRADWYPYEEDVLSPEASALSAAISRLMPRLRAAYDAVYLLPNEGRLTLYAPADGAGFVPDALLFLLRREGAGWVQTQVCLNAGDAGQAADFLLHLERQPLWAEETCGSLRCRVCGLRPFSGQADAPDANI